MLTHQNERIIVRLEKGLFVTFQIFVSALVIYAEYVHNLINQHNFSLLGLLHPETRLIFPINCQILGIFRYTNYPATYTKSMGVYIY